MAFVPGKKGSLPPGLAAWKAKQTASKGGVQAVGQGAAPLPKGGRLTRSHQSAKSHK